MQRYDRNRRTCGQCLGRDRKIPTNGIHLLDELKQKLNGEVKNITQEELKGLKRICAYEYYEVAFYLGGGAAT